MWPKDIHYAFFGNVVRNGFAHSARKAFLRRKLLPGKFWVFAPLVQSMLRVSTEYLQSMFNIEVISSPSAYSVSIFGIVL